WSCNGGTQGTDGSGNVTIRSEERRVGKEWRTHNDVGPQITMAKTVIDDNGGTKVAKDFTLAATGSSGSFSGTAGSDPTSLTGNTGAHTVTAGVTYTLSESGGETAYAVSSNWSCNGGTQGTDGSGNVTI